jgi:nucleotidyltransferase substrate binding protein (TIGR01987 family)
LAWKTLKEVFKDEGLMELNSPKSVLKEAFSSGLIENEKLWINMLKDRNFTLYMYSESISMEISENIKDKYVDTLNKLKDKIVERRKKYS